MSEGNRMEFHVGLKKGTAYLDALMEFLERLPAKWVRATIEGYPCDRIKYEDRVEIPAGSLPTAVVNKTKKFLQGHSHSPLTVMTTGMTKIERFRTHYQDENFLRNYPFEIQREINRENESINCKLVRDVYDTPATSEFYRKYVKFVNEMTEALQPKFAYGCLNQRGDIKIPFFEYYDDPYVFCSPIFSAWYSKPAYDIEYMADLLSAPIIRAEANEAKRVLSSKELRDVIRDNVYKTVETRRGIGVWRREPDYELYSIETVPFAFPHYFVRKEARKRGANLYYGRLEGDLLSQLASFQEQLLKASLINKNTFDRVQTAINAGKFDPSEYEKIEKACLDALSTDAIHQLGLDLPKPPEWMLKPEGWN